MKLIRVGKHMLTVIAALCMFVLAGCGASSSAPPIQTPAATQPVSASTEQPVPVISGTQANSSDIPDTQVFVTYTSSPGKYQLDVPEGWAQTASGTDVRYISNLNMLQVTLTSASIPPTVSSVQNEQAISLQQTGRAVRAVHVQDVQLPNGSAILITYTSNSDPNPVTNKQVRLENNSYLFYKNGKLATLTLSAPIGADNVDQWARIAKSFRWG